MPGQHPIANKPPALEPPGARRGRRLAAALQRGGTALMLSPTLLLAAPVSTNLPPMNTALPDAGFSVLRVFGALALVLALFLGGVWLFKNWRRLALQRGGRAPQLQVMEVRPLGQRHVLYVVGYQQQRMLLAASPAGVALVSHLPAADAAELVTDPTLPAPNFVEALQQMVRQRT